MYEFELVRYVTHSEKPSICKIYQNVVGVCKVVKLKKLLPDLKTFLVKKWNLLVYILNKFNSGGKYIGKHTPQR